MLDPLYNLVARGIIVFHDGLGAIFGKHGFFTYAIAIALIVVIVRILIFPLFVRSVRAQRTMQMLQPRIKEIREKYKNDKQRMNQEVMKLQKEHGNPLLGCLPLLLQIPLFIALYHVFNAISRPPTMIANGILQFKATSGLTGGCYDKVHHILGVCDLAHPSVVHASSSGAEVAGIATAKFGGVTLGSALSSSKRTLDLLGANGAVVKVVAIIMIITMAITVYITQRQIMSRGGPVDPQQQKIQRIMLYGSPILLAVFGIRFPIAVLVYWLTTNTWSMGQQFFILRKMPPVLPGTTAGSASSGRATAPAKGKPSLRKGAPPEPPPPPPRLTQMRQAAAPEPDPPSADGQEPEESPEVAEPEPTAESNGTPPPAKAPGTAGSGTGSSGSGRTVSSGGSTAGAARRNNRPAAKRKGKGPRKGGRR